MNTYMLISMLLLLFTTMAMGQSTDTGAPVPVSTGGFNPDDGQQQARPEESWIKRDYHYVIVIVVVLVVVALVLYYIVRSIRGMRQRLARENEQQLQMINQSHHHQHPQPPQYQSQPYSPIDERPAMMDGYKFDQQQQQQQQPNPHLHRY